MDAFAWANDAAAKLKEEFGDRLVFVGLQGSRARGEANEESDIDLVALFDRLDASDLARYRTIIQSMPHAELACGFVGATDVLASWPRHELFQFAYDTHAILGDLAPIVGTFTRDDALRAARIGASGIYHAACHAAIFDGGADEILRSLFKGAFFTMQAIHFARTGVYPRSKAELARILKRESETEATNRSEETTPDTNPAARPTRREIATDARILAIGRDWEAHRPATNLERQELTDLLLAWAGGIVTAI